jgi:hypothetical protein
LNYLNLNLTNPKEKNKMNIPGFSAEASLYKTSDYDYIATTLNSLVDSQKIQPALSYDICGSCFKTGPHKGFQFCRGFDNGHLVYRGWFPCDL